MNLEQISSIQGKVDVLNERLMDTKEVIIDRDEDTNMDLLVNKLRMASEELITILQEVIPEDKQEMEHREFTNTRNRYMNKLFHIICETFDVPPEDLRNSSNTRKRIYVVPRQIHMAFLIKTFKMSQENAGGKYNKDHATALHAYRTVRNIWQTDIMFREQLQPIVDHCVKYDNKYKKTRTMEYLEGRDK